MTKEKEVVLDESIFREGEGSEGGTVEQAFEQIAEGLNETIEPVNKTGEELKMARIAVNAASESDTHRTLEHVWSNTLYKALEGKAETQVKDVLSAFVPLLGVETKDIYAVADLAIDKLSAGERDGKPIHTLLSDSEIVLEAQRVAAVWLFRDLLAPVDDSVLDPAVDFTDAEVKALTDFAWKEIEEDTCRKELGLPAQVEKKSGKKGKKKDKTAQTESPAAGTPAPSAESECPGPTEEPTDTALEDIKPSVTPAIISARFRRIEERHADRQRIHRNWIDNWSIPPALCDPDEKSEFDKAYKEYSSQLRTANHNSGSDFQVLLTTLRTIQIEHPYIQVGVLIDKCYDNTPREAEIEPLGKKDKPPADLPGQLKLPLGKKEDDGSEAEPAGECTSTLVPPSEIDAELEKRDAENLAESAEPSTTGGGAVNAQEQFDKIEALRVKLGLSDADINELYEIYLFDNTKPVEDQLQAIENVLWDLEQQEFDAEDEKDRAAAPVEKKPESPKKSGKQTKSSKPGKTSKKK